MRPKNPRDLSHADLAGIVERMQRVLYWDEDRRRWDREKEHDEETLSEVEDVMAEAGLVPRRLTGWTGKAREVYAFPELAQLGLVTVYGEGEAFLVSLKLRTILAEGEGLEADESVPHIDLSEPFGKGSIEEAAAEEVGLDPTEGFPGWDAVFDFLERHPEVLGR